MLVKLLAIFIVFIVMDVILARLKLINYNGFLLSVLSIKYNFKPYISLLIKRTFRLILMFRPPPSRLYVNPRNLLKLFKLSLLTSFKTLLYRVVNSLEIS